MSARIYGKSRKMFILTDRDELLVAVLPREGGTMVQIRAYRDKHFRPVRDVTFWGHIKDGRWEVLNSEVEVWATEIAFKAQT